MSSVLKISTGEPLDPNEPLDSVVPNDSVDSIVFSIISQFVNRAKFGKEKYGVSLDREDLSMLEWIQHAQEEHMDAILYLEKIKKEYNKKEIDNSK